MVLASKLIIDVLKVNSDMCWVSKHLRKFGDLGSNIENDNNQSSIKPKSRIYAICKYLVRFLINASVAIHCKYKGCKAKNTQYVLDKNNQKVTKTYIMNSLTDLILVISICLVNKFCHTGCPLPSSTTKSVTLLLRNGSRCGRVLPCCQFKIQSSNKELLTVWKLLKWYN